MSNPFLPLGNFRSLKNASDRLTLTAQRGIIEVAALSGGVVRVRIQPGRRKQMRPHRSLAVSDQLALQPPLKPKAAKDEITLKGEGVTTHIRLSLLGLSFSRASGAAFASDLSIGARGGQIVVRKTLNPDEHVYGLGEKTGWLDKRHRRWRMRNTDVLLEKPEIGLGTDPLYASFPVFIVHSVESSYGIFVDNPEFAEFDFVQPGAYEFSAPADALNYYVLPGPTLPDVLRQYTGLTGRMPLPALWTLGYQQCRWGYESEDDVRRIAAELRKRKFPSDAIWFDIDYMDGYRVFTWDDKDFPHPARLMADLRGQGFRAVTIVDPGVKVDPQYHVYREGRRAGHFIKHPDGKEYNGSVWPGRSAFPDFHRAETRVWWAGLVRGWLDASGLSGLWNDMNEPATTDMTGPVDEVQHAGGKLPHTSARNTYALQMARATYAGMLEHDPDARPFILTRAAFCGAQTVAALWGGDNGPYWEHLAGSLPLLMNLGLSGMPFVGVDIGGFNGDTHGELLARWTQAGAFYPFCRNHAARGTNLHEPWAFGPEVEAICRRYLELRYQLLPYLYNLFYEAAQTGAPIMRPLVWHYPRDRATFNLNDEFLLGPDLLVAPVLAPGLAARTVYLPEGRWYRFPWSVLSGGQSEAKPAVEGRILSGAARKAAQSKDVYYDGPTHILAHAPLDELPLFVRGGAILPMWPLAQHTGAIDRASLTLHIWPGKGQLDYYEDDGETGAYTRGERRITSFRVQANSDGITLRWGPGKGRYTTGRSHWAFAFHALPQGKAFLDGQPIKAQWEDRLLTVRVEEDGERHEVRVISG